MSNPPHGYKMSKAALDALTLSLAQSHAEHGNAALSLASEEARFITGVLLPVDGGQSARVG